MIFNYKNTPFILCNNVKLQNINASNSPKFLKSLPCFEILPEVSKFCYLQCDDVDFNLLYYSVNDFQNTTL